MSERLEKARAAWDEARAKKSKAEYDEKVEPLLFENIGKYFELKVEDAAPEFAQWIVMRKPTPGEHSRLMHTMWEDGKKNGAVEAKAKAGRSLAACCLVYPPTDEYEALIEEYPHVANVAGDKAFKVAGAGADADAKS